MPNAIEDFLHALKRTIKGDPYPATTASSHTAIRYRVVHYCDPLEGHYLGSGKYRIVSRLGKGAMATVYKAVQEPIERVVAVKVLNKTYSADAIAVKRFNREAKTLAALRHRNILSIHDLGITDQDQPYFVMEFLDGLSLEKLIADRGAVPVARALPLFMQICEGMQYAHNHGLIHRDLKPANVMLVRDEAEELVKLVDFGIVKLDKRSQTISQQLTQKGEIWGSPVYMSPEQCLGSELDARSDVYSLGLLMYETLLGKSAFEGANIGAIVSKQLSQMPAAFKDVEPTLRIPEGLERVVFKALQKKPENRPQSMNELKSELETFARQCGIRLKSSSAFPAISPETAATKQSEKTAEKVYLNQSEVLDKSEAKDKPSPSAEKQESRPALEASKSSKAPEDYRQKQSPESRSAGPSSNNIILLLAASALILLAVIGIAALLLLNFKASFETKNPRQENKGVTQTQSRIPAPEIQKSTKPIPAEQNLENKNIDESNPEQSKLRHESANDQNLDKEALKKELERKRSLEQQSLGKQIKKASSKKAKKAALRETNRSSNSNSESDDALLERIHLRKHQADATQQWLQIQEKEQ
ncbi:MAG: protein kinase [Candidatus Obscuribacterales bacterium]|nr:protein kinase [Candidatus Obscuribacterales bacterium]